RLPGGEPVIYAIAVAVVQLVTAGALGVLVVRRTAPPSAPLVGATVVLTTLRDDRTYKGVVLAEHADRLVLREAFWIRQREGGRPEELPVGGLLHVPRADCSAVQQLPGEVS